jgi:hypothetical protein
MKTEIRLVADVGAGEGDISISPHFDSMNSLWQIDVLQDWIADLTNEYNKRLGVWRGELRSSLKSD